MLPVVWSAYIFVGLFPTVVIALCLSIIELVLILVLCSAVWALKVCLGAQHYLGVAGKLLVGHA